jgi:hypothetical protein
MGLCGKNGTASLAKRVNEILRRKDALGVPGN